MTWLDRALHILGLAGAGYTAVSAASDFHGPKWLAVGAAVATYVATGAARSFVSSKATEPAAK